MRSLAGTRDTEIATTVWQSEHMRKLIDGSVTLPRGQVHGFRMSLWKEHLGMVTPEMEETLRDPGTLECSRLVQQCSQVQHLYIPICKSRLQ
jgi:phospholipase D1/2